MQIELSTIKGIVIAELISDTLEIKNLDDALDLIGNAGYQGATAVIIYERNLNPDFFDLKTKLAGDILQKFSTYNLKLAIIGDYPKYTSKSLKDFIYESNKVGRINFVSSLQEARETLSSF